MKNKNIIDSFKVITPSTEEKDLMLDNILKRKEKRTIPFIKLLPATLFLFLIILLNCGNEVKTTNYNLVTLRQNKLEFVYRNKCYQESNILSNTDNLKRLGIISSIENNNLKNIPLYKNKNDNIIIKLDNYYITFVEINCFKNEKG